MAPAITSAVWIDLDHNFDRRQGQHRPTSASALADASSMRGSTLLFSDDARALRAGARTDEPSCALRRMVKVNSTGTT